MFLFVTTLEVMHRWGSTSYSIHSPEVDVELRERDVCAGECIGVQCSKHRADLGPNNSLPKVGFRSGLTRRDFLDELATISPTGSCCFASPSSAAEKNRIWTFIEVRPVHSCSFDMGDGLAAEHQPAYSIEEGYERRCRIETKRRGKTKEGRWWFVNGLGVR